ncbi:hypothetical protein RHGRI_013398 [Rhododendron griersonianum]|uniref:Agglutinin domain-containing protein n=1 Tax=Rhododendron griersonianum TaxID=479676 RepID=A0AAV6K5E2_9ERIC|nr:hypothetical protein RHGRI_013398 [Rhododendron griersonianum]
MALPRFVVIKSLSNEKYLCPSGPDSLQKFEGVGYDSWGVKHEAVKAKSGGGLVHIRCCQAKKYWSREVKQGNIIAAQAEDGTTAACMLIKPSNKDSDGVTFVNFHLHWKSKWHSIGKNSGGYLESGENLCGSTVQDFIISDWEELSRARQSRITGVYVRTEETTINDGIFIANTNTGVGVSVADTNIGGSGSAGNMTRGGVSVANTNIGPGIGGRIVIGARTVTGGIFIGRSSS